MEMTEIGIVHVSSLAIGNYTVTVTMLTLMKKNGSKRASDANSSSS